MSLVPNGAGVAASLVDGFTVGTDATTLSRYKSAPQSAAIHGCTTSPTVLVTATRVGNLVVITFGKTAGNLTKSGSGVISIDALAADFRPTNNIWFFNTMLAGGTRFTGAFQYDTSGVLSVGADNGYNNIAGGVTSCGWDQDISMSFVIQ